MDVTIHNALLDNSPKLVNIGIENGQIVKITTDALSSGEQSIDAQGRLVIPPFFETHFHLDNTLIWGDYKTHALSEAIEAFSRAKVDMDRVYFSLGVRFHQNNSFYIKPLNCGSLS